MNNVAKGVRTESLAKKLLESQGYLVHRVVRTSFSSKGIPWHPQDIFGCIDLIAKKAGERTRWIQVTAGRSIGRKKESLRKVDWTIDHDSVEIWRWIDGSGPILDKRSGKPRPRRTFVIYRLDQDFDVKRAERIHIPLNSI
jgi:Holliday junction resolvase-like predicted endonuclease